MDIGHIMNIIIGANPLDPKHVEKHYAPIGSNLKEWLVNNPLPKNYAYIYYLNGFTDNHILLNADREITYFQEGDVVIAVPQLLGRGGGSNPLKVLAALALVVFAAPIAGFLAGATGLTAITATMVARFGATLLLSAFTQPKPVEGSSDIKDASPTYSVSAQGNALRIGAPIPKVYGRHIIYPSFIFAPWSMYYNNKQYLTQGFIIGHGNYVCETPKLEDSLITSFAAIDWAFIYYDNYGLPQYQNVYNGLGWNSWLNEKHHRVVTSVEVSGQVLLGTNETGYNWVGPFVVNKSGTEISEIELDIVCPRGLYYANDNGSFASKTVNWTFEAQRISDSGITLGSWFPLTVNQTNTGSSSARLEIPMQEPNELNKYPTLSVIIDTWVKGTSGIAYKTGSGQAADLINYYVWNSGNNDHITATVKPKYNWISSGEGSDFVWCGTVEFSFNYSYMSNVANPSLTAATNEVQQVTYTAFVNPGRYQVRGIRTNAKDTSARAGHELRWASMKGYLTKAPQYKNMTILYTRMQASDALSQQASRKVNCVVTSILPVFQSGQWLNLPTRNPYWVMLDILRASYGANVTDNYIDIEGFKTLAVTANQNNEYFDYVADQRVAVWDALMLVGRTCRTSPSRVAGKVYLVKDVAREYPSGVFTENQMRAGTFKIQRIMPNSRASSWIEAEFFDSSIWNWNKVTVGTKPPQLDAVPLQIRLDGVTTQVQALKEATYLSKVNKYRRQFVTFETEMDGFIPTYGDMILVSHNLPNWGQNTYVTDIIDEHTFTVANDLDWTVGALFSVAFRNNNGTLSDIYAATKGETDNELIVTGFDLTTLGWEFTATEPTTVLFGPTEIWAKPCLVLACKPRSLNHIVIEAVLDNPEVYDTQPWAPGLPVGEGVYTVPNGVYKIRVAASGAVSGESAWQVYINADNPDEPYCATREVDPLWDGSPTETMFMNYDISLLPVSYYQYETGFIERNVKEYNVTPGQQIPYVVGQAGLGMVAPNIPAFCADSGLTTKNGRDGFNGYIRITAL